MHCTRHCVHTIDYAALTHLLFSLSLSLSLTLILPTTGFEQLNYADMLNRVDPLRRELQTLEKQAETTRIKGEEINKIINELEASINRYKEEYALLISEANAIKADLETVEAKVQIFE